MPSPAMLAPTAAGAELFKNTIPMTKHPTLVAIVASSHRGWSRDFKTAEPLLIRSTSSKT